MYLIQLYVIDWIRRGRDRMTVGFTTTYVITAYHTNVVSLIPFMARCTRYKFM
jgi:hypothetical protein